MKSYDEMTKCVLNARDEYVQKKKRQNEIIRKTASITSSFCFVVLLGIGMFNLDKMPKSEQFINYREDTDTNTCENTKESDTSTTTNSENKSENVSENPVTSQNITSTANDIVIGSEHTDAEKTEDNTVAITQPDTTVSGTLTEKPTTPIVTDIGEAVTATSKVSTALPTTEQITTTKIEYTTDAPAEQTTTQNKPLDEDVDNNTYLHWDEMTINQQYFLAEFGEPLVFYSTLEKEISASEVGEYICQAYMSGYDWYESVYYHCEAEVYKIKGDNAGNTIAIKFSNDDKYYLYYTDASNDKEEFVG